MRVDVEYIVRLDRKKRFNEILPVLQRIKHAIEQISDTKLKKLLVAYVEELYDVIHYVR